MQSFGENANLFLLLETKVIKKIFSTFFFSNHMNIQTLKNQTDILKIAEVLGISIGKNDKAICPFHEEKTPSLQFSREKQICTCFSSNCGAGTMDVVDLVKKYKGWELPEALEWLAEQVGYRGEEQGLKNKFVRDEKTQKVSLVELSEGNRIKLLTNLFETFVSGLLSGKKPQDYLKNRGLDHRKMQVGYNAGTYHYASVLGENAETYQGFYESLGLLKKVQTGYQVFGKGCLVFPLRNVQNQIVSFYFRGTDTSKTSQHYYLKNRVGLYPNYPKKECEFLVLTESVIDAETLLQYADNLNNYEVLACYGTEGFKEQVEAIKSLENLKELVVFFDGDQPGKEGGEKLAKILQLALPNLKISIVQTPDGEDINSLLEGHEANILTHLIKNTKAFFLSMEKEKSAEKNPLKEKKEPLTNLYKLDSCNPFNYKYETETAFYEIKGGIEKNGMDRLMVSLHISLIDRRKKSRLRFDLYEDKQVEKAAKEAGEKLGLRSDLIEEDLNHLADLLDELRSSKQEAETLENPKLHVIPEREKKEAFELLKSQGKYAGNLIENINKLIGKAGVMGEENNRIFLFCIASSHKMFEPLHALVQGSSGSGKTHLLRQIADLMPPENVIRLTRVTESSFYNYGEFDLQYMLIIIEDYDGLKEDAELAFRELQTGDISSQVSVKSEEYADYKTKIKYVRGPISSISATTKGAIYEDNLSRCFVISVDESLEQTLNIIKYQNNGAAGASDNRQRNEIQILIQNSIRLLKQMEVVNPFANKIDLPPQAFKIRRLNGNFQSFVKQITLLNQYQRKTDEKGRLITEKQDVETAIKIMFDSIVLKVDELDGLLRGFYEKLKSYVQKKGENYEFTQREIRQHLRLSKTQMHRFMTDLIELEYLQQSGGYANRGFKYKIQYWDSMELLRNQIRDDLNQQLENL